jgi:quinol monooxygenase YgiN
MVLVVSEALFFLAAIVFTGFWIASPSANYESYAALFGLLGGGVELLRRRRPHKTMSDHDRQLARIFRSLFADSGMLRLYQGHDFLLPFKKEATVPLYTIVETWTDEAHYFVHPRLRSKQATFIKAANELAGEVLRYTVPDGQGNVSVVTRDMDPENLPSHVKAEAKAIDAKLPEFLRAHEALLALCNELA